MRKRSIYVIALLVLAALSAAPPASAKGTLSDEDKAEILALTEKVEQAIISKDLVALQSLCDPYCGLWVDAGYGLLISYGWEQIPQMIETHRSCVEEKR